MKYTTTTENPTNAIAHNAITTTTPTPTNIGGGGGSDGSGNQNWNNNNAAGNASAHFCEQVSTVTNLFDKWNDCERTVVMYALLKRLRYPSIRFLQYSIEHNLTQNLGSTQSNLSTVVIDMNANNPSYLQNLLNAYQTSHLSTDMVDTLSSSSSSDKDSMPSCYGSDFQLTPLSEERRRSLFNKKEDILHEVLNMLPLLKPGNDEAKLIYLALTPIAVEDTLQQVVPTELVQQIFSYLLIHPAISSEDRKSLNIWLRHLEEHIQTCSSSNDISQQSYFLQAQAQSSSSMPFNNNVEQHTTMTSSGSSSTSSVSSSSSSSAVSSGGSNMSVASSSAVTVPLTAVTTRNADWQTIAPPSKAAHHHQSQSKPTTLAQQHDWSSVMSKQGLGAVDQLCDNLNGITLNELASSQNQNSLGLSLGPALVDATTHSGGGGSGAETGLTLVNGVVAAAGPSLFGSSTNPIINIINHNNNSSCGGAGANMHGDDNDNSFSKNGTEILDFEPLTTSSNTNACDSCSSSSSNIPMQHPSFPHVGYAHILMNNCNDQMDTPRWSLDSKLAALKTRRSNSLTTQTISSSTSSSSNSSVITVNDNCSNSTENLAQFANKPRSYSLSIEHQRGGALANGGSDTRLDEFKPNYIKFQTNNIGMSSIGLWLKSLRLHKYIDLFKNTTYEEMLKISEDYLQSLGVTKGASHKLALCIEKLRERPVQLAKMEQDLFSGQLKVQAAIEELANIALTPMKPIDAISLSVGEDNVALLFLKVIDLVVKLVQKDPYLVQDEENISILVWILDRSMHSDAFANNVNQLKEHKFKISKLRMSFVPKILHAKNGSNGNLNKPRWSSKTRKSDPKNGSNDRINHRKNSNDFNFSQTQQQQQQHHHNNHHQQQQQHSDYDKFQQMVNNNNNNSGSGNNAPNNNSSQQHRASYPNFNQQQQQINQQIQQQQHMQQIMQQVSHFSTPQQQQQLQQHRRSLNSLIVVSGGGPQQPQKMIYKTGQGISSSGTGAPPSAATTDNLQMASAVLKNQVRKASLNELSSTNNTSHNLSAPLFKNVTNAAEAAVGGQQKKSMASVVMVSDDIASGGAAPPHILINNNSNIINNNLISQQQQQHHLQLLAAAAAAVGSSCNLNNSINNSNHSIVNCICSNMNTNNNSNSSCSSNSNSSCSNCNNLPTTYESPLAIAHALSMLPPSVPYKEASYHASQSATASAQAATMNDIKSLEQLETLCLQMTEQAIN